MDPSYPVILVIDRLGLFHAFAEAALGPAGYRVVRHESADSAMPALRRGPVQAVLVDVCVPGQDLLDGVKSLIDTASDARTIVVTGCPIMDAAARFLYPPADAFIQKPCTTDELRRIVATSDEEQSSVGAVPQAMHGLVGTSPAIRRIIEQIHTVAPTRATVLITGETGTGKEVVAAAIHECSSRRARPYVVVDTAALPETLAESELFGHTRGAFTGATGSKQGLFEFADGGTVFLDEIGDVPPAIQVRLLRAIQEGEVRPIGAVEPIDVDVRIIAATQRNLEEAVRSGRIRADLYYRLSVYNIAIPPLRERLEDIRPLVQHALAGERAGSSPPGSCSELALEMLETYDWPGNVRELLSAIERARIQAGGPLITARHLPERVRSAWRESMLDEERPDRRAAVKGALRETGGRRAETAELLGISRTTLWRWMKEYGL